MAVNSYLIFCNLTQKTVGIESDWSLAQVILHANELIFQNIPCTFSLTSNTASKLIKRALELQTHLKKVDVNVTNCSDLTASYFPVHLKHSQAYCEFFQGHLCHVLEIFFILSEF